jgi:hypothetical protein
VNPWICNLYDSGLAIGAYSLTRNKSFIDRYQKLVNQISPTVETLHQLVDKQPVKEISFSEINQVAQAALKQLEDAKTILNNSSITPFNDDQGEIRSLAPASGVVLYVDNEKMYQPKYGTRRDFIAELFHNSNYLFSGFDAFIPTKDLQLGWHLLSMKVVSKDKKLLYETDVNIKFILLDH